MAKPLAVIKKRKKLTMAHKDGISGVTMMLPAFIILGLVVFFPIIKGIWMSFNDYTISTMNNPTWNNFQNYIDLFKSGEIFTYFSNTIVYVGFTVFIQFVLAMAFALLLNTNIKGRSFFRGMFLIPWTIPSVVVAILWSWMLQPQYGVVNYLLYALGWIQDPTMQWVQSVTLAMPSVIVAAVWKQMPYMLVMILAGLQSIPKDYMEAAEIDGANKWKVFRHIMIPSIRPVLITSVMIAILNNFQMFTLIYNMTGGGPINMTTTLSIAAFTKAFTEYDFGAGAAIGVLWLLVLMIFSVINNKKSDMYRAM